MSKVTFRIISGITTIVAGAAVTIVTAIGCPNASIVNACIIATAGAIDEVCSLFIKELPDASN